MVLRVKVGGQWLDRLYTATNAVDSTIYRTGNWSGDYMASCDWAAPGNFRPSWLRRGARYEHVEGGEVTWSGTVVEIEDDEHISIHALGHGAQTDDYRSLTVDGLDLVPTAVPDTGFDHAVAVDGMNIARHESLGISPVKVDEASELMTITTLLNRAAAGWGQRWWVDSFPEIFMVEDPTVPLWIIQPRTAYLGTADDDYVTHLYGRYVSAVDGTTGLPTAYGVVVAGDNEAADQFGRRAYDVDLTPLGLMSEAAAQDNIDGRFVLVGARMGFTNGIEVVPGMLRRLDNSAIATPMSMHGRKGAGSMLRVPGITDTRSNPTTRGAIDLVLGQVTRYHLEQRVEVSPVGFTPRDLQGALNVDTAAEPSVAA